MSSYGKLIEVRPINKKWFIKLSLLLKKGNYSYSKANLVKFRRYNFKTYDLISYRNKVIENSLFNLIFPFFQNNYLFKNASLIEYLRMIHIFNFSFNFRLY